MSQTPERNPALAATMTEQQLIEWLIDWLKELDPVAGWAAHCAREPQTTINIAEAGGLPAGAWEDMSA